MPTSLIVNVHGWKMVYEDVIAYIRKSEEGNLLLVVEDRKSGNEVARIELDEIGTKRLLRTFSYYWKEEE